MWFVKNQVAHSLLFCIAFVNSYVFLVGGTVLPVVLQGTN